MEHWAKMGLYLDPLDMQIVVQDYCKCYCYIRRLLLPELVYLDQGWHSFSIESSSSLSYLNHLNCLKSLRFYLTPRKQGRVISK